MRTAGRFQTLGLSTLLAGSLMLTGCGGGGAEPAAAVASSGLVKPTAHLEQTASVASQCGVPVLEDMATSGQVGLTTNKTTGTDSDGYDEVVSYLVSGDYFDTHARMDIRLPMSDLRNPSFHPNGGNNTMGVAMTGPYLLGSVGCIKSVGKVRILDDSGDPSSITTAWTSVDISSLPVDDLSPKAPINGFEFLSNFDIESPIAIFDVATSTIHDPDNVDICRLTSSSTWSCVKANVANNGLTYRFSAPMSGAGVYVLITPVQAD